MNKVNGTGGKSRADRGEGVKTPVEGFHVIGTHDVPQQLELDAAEAAAVAGAL